MGTTKVRLPKKPVAPTKPDLPKALKPQVAEAYAPPGSVSAFPFKHVTMLGQKAVSLRQLMDGIKAVFPEAFTEEGLDNFYLTTTRGGYYNSGGDLKLKKVRYVKNPAYQPHTPANKKAQEKYNKQLAAWKVKDDEYKKNFAAWAEQVKQIRIKAAQSTLDKTRRELAELMGAA